MPRIPDSLPTAAHFSARRNQVLEEIAGSALVLQAGRLQFKSGDTEYRFRTSSEFQYLVGWGEPDAVLVLRAHADDDRFVLFVPSRQPDIEVWTGARLGVEGACDRLGADAAYPLEELEQRLPDLLNGADHLFTRLGVNAEMDRLITRTLVKARSRAGRTGGGPTGVQDPGLVLDDLRLFKEDIELELIREACAVTVAGFRAAIPGVAPGRGEWEVQGALEGTFIGEGAFGPAFGTIVGSGPRACTLHYTANDHRLPDDGFVLIDAGAEFAGYSGDVTRSLPIRGHGSELQRRLYETVDEARAAAIGAVRPGATVDEVEAAARERLKQGLTELGLWTGNSNEERQARFKRLAPHKVSHWLGLDVHDVGAYRVHGAGRVLKPGMVMTIEPGLYIQPDDEAAQPELRGVGIRVEDDVLVTRDGAENLTAELPTDLDALCALRDGSTA